MKPKTWTLVAYAALSLVTGAASQYVYPGRETTVFDYVSLPVFLLLTFLWYRLDAAERGYRRSSMLNIGVVGLTAVALPYYFFKSRGAKGGLLATGGALLMLVLSGTLSYLGSWAVFEGLQR